MKLPAKKFLFFLWILSACFCRAQEKSVLITSSHFNNAQNRFVLSETDGWYFRQGNDPAWAAKEISMNRWKKMQPAELNQNYADGNGKVEGWFRIKIRLDSSLANIPSGILSPVWAASDVYVNEKLAASFGQTGSHGVAYLENKRFGEKTVSVEFRPGETYSIAVHVVDYLVPFSGGSLKSGNEVTRLLVLITPETPPIEKIINDYLLRISVLLTITGVISILFWFFWLLNTKEKNQLLFALCCTFISLCILNSVLLYLNSDISFNSLRVYDFLFYFCMVIVQLLIFTIIIRVLNYKGPRLLRIAMYSMLGVVFFASQLPKLVSIAAVINILYVIVCVSIIAKCWKKLKGAQWAIVIGLLSTIIFAMLSFGIGIIFPSLPGWATYLIYAVAVISFPFGLMIYAAIRFSEINRETEIQASRVIQLSEEKKEQAINQQKILQEEVNRQTADLRNTLENLKATQAQLIQSEKMASLGELTAGIAHEIQNPLNFVNNFSEVNKELVDEMQEELKAGKIEDAISISNDIKENEEKINHHGKRADAIVKGMLQHSRSSSGVKQPTDINALADEYLRLAYHGLRAKDKSFNATLKTDYDETIGNINIIPQDIGRVILNLINNAFYAVIEKQNQNIPGYEPTVTVSTKKLRDKIEIKVKDNGNGIPQKVLDKIFQPFFTTKPTGQGTGLGLSLAYDIIKAHAGELKVETKEDTFTEFIIRLSAGK